MMLYRTYIKYVHNKYLGTYIWCFVFHIWHDKSINFKFTDTKEEQTFKYAFNQNRRQEIKMPILVLTSVSEFGSLGRFLCV